MLGGASHSLRLPKSLVVGVIAIAGVAAIVAYTGTGLDVLALALLILLVVIVERTVGDWFAELMGPALSSAVLAGAAGLCVWQLLAGGGRETTYTFFAAAEQRGYRTLYLNQALEYGSQYGLRRMGTTGSSLSSADSRPVSAPRPSSVPSPDGAPASSSVARSRIALVPADATKDAIDRDLSKILVVNVPSEAQAGKAVPVRASLATAGKPVRSGKVEFLIDGRVVGSADIRSDGTAVAELMAPAVGTHKLRVRLAGAAGVRGASTETTLVVRRSN